MIIKEVMNGKANESSYILDSANNPIVYTITDNNENSKKVPGNNDRKDGLETSKKRGWSRLNITVEPIGIATGFCQAFTGGLLINFLENAICYKNYHHAGQNCRDKISADELMLVDYSTATYNMMLTMLQAVFPLFLCMFIAPWSDVNGRKPFIILPMLGFTINFTLWGLLSLTNQVPIYIYMIPPVILSMSGGNVAIFLCSTSYLYDTSSREERVIRFSVFSGLSMLANVLGNVLSPIVFYNSGKYGYPVIFLTAALLSCLALIYTLVVLEETIQTKEGMSSKFFDVALLKSVFNVLFINPSKGRLAMLCILTGITGEIITSTGDTNVAYLVGISQFSWSLEEYNLFVATTTVSSAFFSTTVVWLLRKILKLPNKPAIVFLSFCIFSMEIVKGFSTSDMMFWISAFAITTFSALGSLNDDELFTSIREEDSGKICAGIALIDNLAPLIAAPMYSELYKCLLPNHACYVYFLSTCFLFLSILASLGLYFKDKNPKDPYNVFT